MSVTAFSIHELWELTQHAQALWLFPHLKAPLQPQCCMTSICMGITLFIHLTVSSGHPTLFKASFCWCRCLVAMALLRLHLLPDDRVFKVVIDVKRLACRVNVLCEQSSDSATNQRNANVGSQSCDLVHRLQATTNAHQYSLFDMLSGTYT